MEATLYVKKLFDIIASLKATDIKGGDFEFNTAIDEVISLITSFSKKGNKLMFIGNGGSAAIASHEAIDFSKNGRIRSMCFNEAALLTCLGNDYGYEYVFSKSLEIFADPDDILIAISSSGRSQNILNAVATARKLNCRVITLSGFTPDNPLRANGNFNFYVDSKVYGFVELSHQILLHMILDVITNDWKDKL